jgi:hypothetical protein
MAISASEERAWKADNHGQVDLMVGMGTTSYMDGPNMRMLSFPKNKVSGVHTPIQIQIEPFTSRIIE